ncbi:uncharacterized protein LOC126896381 [Daktulosphaira vitifoliae]|uniref:uncharacterized protein LOC126896381 n=1 Tax=Daktulosphaira vitifoliae TaxID=58002 RepID=UPI0021AA68DA|nr:uncharacterized protein LOC126896381 [Daktulosphaira vitifoliae]
MMEINKYENWIFNIRLAKFLGYYYILNPKTKRGLKFVGFLVKLGIIYIAAISTCIMFGLYQWKNDLIQFILQIIVLQNMLFAAYRMCLFMKDSEIIWDILKITNLEFLCIENYNKNILIIWRAISMKYTNLIAVLTFFVLLVWSSSGYILNNISADTYNTYFPIFHIIETLCAIVYILFALPADITLISVSLSIVGQLDVINDSFENVGILYKENILRKNIDVKELQKKVKFDFKNIIYNSQNVIRKMEQFYNLFQQVILVQIVVLFINLVLYSYTGMLHFINGGMVNSIQTVKLIAAFLFFVCHLFILCIFFGIINDRKDSLLLGIYCSNWTEMDLENKKLVLLTMNMNNAHQPKMKITRSKTVDLIMFVGALKTCYSVLSVLRNTQLSNSQI